MDKVKILLLSLIVLIAYYLLMQWPPNVIQESEGGPPSVQEKKISESNKIEIIPKNGLNSDSKDLLTPLASSGSLGGKDLVNALGGNGLTKIFFFENDVLKIGIDAYSGKFVTSLMKDMKVIKGGEDSLSILGNRGLNEEKSCSTDEGAIKVGEECFGNYNANSGFFSEEGYIYPNYKFIEKTSLGTNKNLYTLSGENSGLYFVRKLLINNGEYSSTEATFSGN
ncbi:uncharacterized protein METZ01_LOCUS444621, partial [marine metagenome]